MWAGRHPECETGASAENSIHETKKKNNGVIPVSAHTSSPYLLVKRDI
jgi:hypothetical protein